MPGRRMRDHRPPVSPTAARRFFDGRANSFRWHPPRGLRSDHRRCARGAPRSRTDEVHMRRIVVSEFVTLDGVMQDPGGAENFSRGGWAFLFERGADGDQYKVDELMAADALLLGRRTFEGFAAAGPGQTGGLLTTVNAVKRVVELVDEITRLSWPGTHQLV